MQTRDIIHEQWQAFFNDFSQLHQGERINVETMGEGTFGVKSRLCHLPLVSIVLAQPQMEQGNLDEWIEVIARDPSQSHATHSITHPIRVRLAEENGQAVALQIEADNGSITMIRFEPPRENMPQGFVIS
jgi:hypothetical protein